MFHEDQFGRVVAGRLSFGEQLVEHRLRWPRFPRENPEIRAIRAGNHRILVVVTKLEYVVRAVEWPEKRDLEPPDTGIADKVGFALSLVPLAFPIAVTAV